MPWFFSDKPFFFFLLFRYEFKTNHEEWIKSVKPKLGRDVSSRVWAAINTTQEDVKTLYKVRRELRAALQSLLKVRVSIFIKVDPLSIVPGGEWREELGSLLEVFRHIEESVLWFFGSFQVLLRPWLGYQWITCLDANHWWKI